ncbi:MAG TPA: carboxypeptidase regulatory-like domain-containing protein [Pyrinomonadaceae bacterium]|nr:carboxypeptidase regulatory-like domain-containing protein [Pyrinomonadaceae bacterium]
MSVLCCCAAVSVRAQTGARAEAPANISGRIVLEEGEGLRGVVITLLSPDPTTRSRPVAKTKTDADGRYLLSDVPPGRYWVTPRAPAYVVNGLANTNSLGRQVIVEAGESVEDFDFKLTRGGVITGRVTNAEGRPLVREAVVVSAAGPNRLENSTGRVYRGTTDDRGVYRVYGLPAGGYRVSAGRGEDVGIWAGPNGFYRPVYYPGTSIETEAKVVEVKAGDEVGDVDIALGTPAKTYRASGRVVNEGGQVVPGVVLQYATEGQGDQRPVFAGAVQADARGEFQLERLTPGRYVVFTSPEDVGEWYGESAPFSVRASDVSGVEVRIRRATTLSGSVRVEGTNDRAKLSRLVSQIRLNVSYEPGGSVASNYQRTISAGPDGTFRVGGLRPGIVRLGTGWPAVKGLTLLRIEYEGADRSRGIEVSEGAQVSGVVAVYAYGDGSVRGQVNVVNGSLPPQTSLAVFVLRPGAGLHFAGRPADVDARGRFTVGGLPSGDYELVVRALRPGMRALEVRQHVNVPEDGETAVTLTLDAGGENN